MQPDDPELSGLAAEFRHADGSDAWRCWRGVNGASGVVYAWRLLSSPPAVLRDVTVAGLRARMVVYENTLIETRSAGRALAAAEQLET